MYLDLRFRAKITQLSVLAQFRIETFFVNYHGTWTKTESIMVIFFNTLALVVIKDARIMMMIWLKG